ncbi:hypothetical protein ACIO1C_00925 [Streptomyces sp. NPDC087420]|uniref:hypothetical protein n=1 Tax=Streptomyces sp. NPDC087420 TaxID=3365785 RepID=UPI003836F91C
MPTDLINTAAVIEAIADPVAREKAARDLQDTLTKAIAAPLAQTKAIRQQAVLELCQSLTLAKTGALLDSSVARVDQLAKGK